MTEHENHQGEYVEDRKVETEGEYVGERPVDPRGSYVEGENPNAEDAGDYTDSELPDSATSSD